MRIVSYQEFVTLPEGTLYCRHSCGAFEEFEIKRANLSNGDWSYQTLGPTMFVLDDDSDDDSYFDTLKRSEKDKAELEMDFSPQTVNSDYDKFYGEKASSGKYTFAIFSKDDIMKMMSRLAFAAGL